MHPKEIYIKQVLSRIARLNRRTNPISRRYRESEKTNLENDIKKFAKLHGYTIDQLEDYNILKRKNSVLYFSPR